MDIQNTQSALRNACLDLYEKVSERACTGKHIPSDAWEILASVLVSTREGHPLPGVLRRMSDCRKMLMSLADELSQLENAPLVSREGQG